MLTNQRHPFTHQPPPSLLHPPTTTFAPSSSTATAPMTSTAPNDNNEGVEMGPKQRLNVVWAPGKFFSYFFVFLFTNQLCFRSFNLYEQYPPQETLWPNPTPHTPRHATAASPCLQGLYDHGNEQTTGERRDNEQRQTKTATAGYTNARN
jgi:hypothetical protein